VASTTPTNVDTAIPEVWANRVLRDHLRAGTWGKFIGAPGSGQPIVQQTELLGKPGDLIHIQTANPLSGSGVAGDTAVLEGNEEALSLSEIRVAPVLTRHGVRINRRANKKSLVELRSEAKMRLAEWGIDKMDNERFRMYTSITASDVSPDATYTPNVYCVGGPFSGGSKADIVAGDKLTVASLRSIRYKLLSQRAQPFIVDGVPYFFMFVSPEVEVDLKGDTDYKNYAMNAQSRGMDNPLFTGAIMNVEGLVIFSDYRVPIGTDGGGASVRYAKNLAFGREAFVEGLDETVTWVEREHFDYGMEWGVAYSFAFKPRRGLELASVQVLSSATVPTT
jgi:N4-gp56 family major capsid protein